MHDLIRQSGNLLPNSMCQDRFVLKRQLDRLRSEFRNGRFQEDKIRALADRIERSCALKKKRKDSFPALEFPDLPVSAKKQEIAGLIEKHQVVIVCGETGSGKTTQLPKICLSIGRGAAGFIGHTQPRRIAARTVADRIAEELGEKIGNSIGYKVRFHDKTRRESLIKLMTDGILLAEVQTDPYLNQYDTIIIDEAHERSLNIDFLLGYMKWLLPKRPDLKLVITSATIDPDRFSRHFSDAPVIEVSGRSYPVDMRYRPINQNEESDETSLDLQQSILDAVDELHREIRGDILIFLSGEREIRETAESLRKHHPAKCEILPLYSKLSLSEQEKVFRPKGQMRIVLATNVAETSLTVPGIRCVIDVGHARISRYSHRSKIQRLPIEKISQASANQRAGRCGRVAEGICIRLYSEDDYLTRSEFTQPEILRTNLASVILQMTSLNLGRIEDFPFLEPPEPKMIRDGIKVLHEINALDENEKLTSLGRQLARFPVDPKLARMLTAAEKLHCLTEVAIIVSGLSIQDPREKPADKMQQADVKHAAFKVEHSDFMSFLKIWNTFEEKKKQLSNSKLRKFCREYFLSYIRMREWHDVHTQIMQVIKGELKLKPNMVEAGYEEIHRALLSGLLSNIGFKNEQYEYLGARNLKFFIFPGSGLYKERPKWLMAAEQVETSKVYARQVAKIEPEWIESCAGHLLKHSYYDPHWEKKAARCAVYQRTTLYGLTLQVKRKIPFERVDPAGAREMFIRFGLVNQDFHCEAPFYQANLNLLEEVGYIQHKGRRVDLIEDEEWLYRFYDSRIPAEVVSGITLNKWRKKSEKNNPHLLFLKKEDLTRDEETHVNEIDFPDSLKTSSQEIKLQYRFEPGHDEDGVTAIIPVHHLNQVTEQTFEWLVPGLLREKMVALVKSLPKGLRKHFVPVPQMVDRCLEIEPERIGSLADWLGNRLRKLTGESVPNNEWNFDILPEHLKMNFRIIDDKETLLDYGRQLKKLQVKYSTEAGDSFDQLAENALNYTGCIQWAFDDLPQTCHFEQKGHKFSGFPAIIDEGKTVGVKIIETEQKAAWMHRSGLVRLFQLQCKKDYKYLLKQMAGKPEIELAYGQLKKHPFVPGIQQHMGYKEALIHLVFDHVFVNDQNIRTQKEFDEVLRANRMNLMTVADQAADLSRIILDAYRSIQKKLIRQQMQGPEVDEIKEHLDCLIYKDFMQTISFSSLQSLPRYLKAVEFRFEKMFKNTSKNETASHELTRFWRHYWDSVSKRQKSELVIPEQERFRWALEELRVSLYAQQLKTAYPISGKRLQKMWELEM